MIGRPLLLISAAVIHDARCPFPSLTVALPPSLAQFCLGFAASLTKSHIHRIAGMMIIFPTNTPILVEYPGIAILERTQSLASFIWLFKASEEKLRGNSSRVYEVSSQGLLVFP